ncbi:MAG: hypothetical protein ACJAUZ_002085, partial [Flavobacteriaceae bacterium]
ARYYTGTNMSIHQSFESLRHGVTQRDSTHTLREGAAGGARRGARRGNQQDNSYRPFDTV